MATDEFHIREALEGLAAIVGDLVELAYDNPEDLIIVRDGLVDELDAVNDHIKSIRVRGDSKREAQSAGAAALDAIRVERDALRAAIAKKQGDADATDRR